MCLVCLTQAVIAETKRVQQGELYYEINTETKTAAVSYRYINPNNYEYSGYSIEDIVIPASISYGGETYSVTGIGMRAFYANGTNVVKSVTIPTSVSYIGAYAFATCNQLTSINIPNSVKSIEQNVFQNCTGLTSIDIGDGVTNIGLGVFSGCTNLTSVRIGKSLSTINNNYAAQYLFNGCPNLRTIIVDPENTTFDSRDNCNAIIRTANNSLVNGCSNTIIPNSVEKINSYAFYECRGLTALDIPSSVTSIGSYAFQSCTQLASLSLSENLTTIGEYAFYGCGSLTTITIPDGVQTIPNSCFQYCSSLESIYIGAAVNTFKSNCIYGCSNLKSIVIDENNTTYDSRDNCNAIIETATNRLKKGIASSTIPNSVKYIGEGAFANLDGLTSVVIPYGVVSIEKEAFFNCKNLQSVDLSATVYNYGTYAFRNCTSLKSVVSRRKNPVNPSPSAYYPTKPFEGIYSKCVLTVPYGTRDAYIAKGWTTSIFGGGIVEMDPILATSITLNEEIASITASDETVALIATVEPSDVTDGSVTWLSSDEGVAIVSSEGVVTAVANGTAIITATTNDGTELSATCTVTVNIPVPATGITLDVEEITLIAAGETVALTATVEPSDVTDGSVTWTSSDEGVAIVSSEGVVTAVANGTAIITATTNDGTELSATCTVTVNIPVPATGITLDVEEITLAAAGETVVLTATVEPTDVTDGSVTWTSSDESVAIVSSEGVVTAVANGTAVITATTNDGTELSATCIVLVQAATAIADVEAECLPQSIYNLQGQRLSVPQKGINIIDGKKVLMK